jgi:hypothetical protein
MTFEPVTSGRYEDWPGLPPALTLAALEKEFGDVVRARAPAARSRTFHTYTVTSFERSGAPVNIEAWVPAGSQHVFLVECLAPPGAGIEATLRAMGDPDLVLEGRLPNATYLVDEFVYLSRGISLLVGRPFTPQAGSGRALLHVRLFSPMTREQYLTEVDDTAGLMPKTNPRGA